MVSRVAPGLVVVAVGLLLLAAGLAALCGWETAAVIVGATLYLTGVTSAMAGGGQRGRGNA
jgi:hypothetical protein